MGAYERCDYKDFAPTSTRADVLIKELERDLDRAMYFQTWMWIPAVVDTAEFIVALYEKMQGCTLGRRFSFEMFHGPTDADEKLKKGPGWCFYIKTPQGFIELWMSNFVSLMHPYNAEITRPTYDFWDEEVSITKLVKKISADINRITQKNSTSHKGH